MAIQLIKKPFEMIENIIVEYGGENDNDRLDKDFKNPID